MSSGNYQVLARKWRPQRFDDVVGQDAVVRALANALDGGRVAHAYCLSGIRGVGKTTVARLLAKGLNCRAGDAATSQPCGECESCVEVEGSRSFDVVELDAASQTGVDNMRQLTEVTRYAPSRDRHRVFIIDEAHMLSTSAFNALLKTLEEPPPHVVFVLATTEPSKVLPTVLSRCQHYPFARISQGQIAAHLRRMADAEGITIGDDSLALLATAADGSLRDAQSLLDKLIAFRGTEIDEAGVIELLGLVDRVLLHRVTGLIGAGDLAGVLGFVNEMVDSGVDLHQFTIDLLGHLRNLLVVRSVPDPGPILHLPEDEMVRLREQASEFEIDDLDRAFSLLAASEYRIKNAEQPRYHVEVILARLARMPRLEPLQDVIDALRGGSGSAPGGPGSPSPGTSRGSAGSRGKAAPRRAADRSRSAPGPAGLTEPRPAARATMPHPAEARPESPPQESPTPELPPPAAEELPPAPEELAAPIRNTEPPRTVAAPAEPEARDEDALPGQDRAPIEDRAADEDSAPGEDAAPGDVLAQIQARIADTHPLIAQILPRTTGLELSGEQVVFQFPNNAAIFSERVNDPAVLAALGKAGAEVLGRPVVARVGLVADPGPLVGATGGGNGAAHAGADSTRAKPSRPAPEPTAARPAPDTGAAVAAATTTAPENRPELDEQAIVPSRGAAVGATAAASEETAANEPVEVRGAAPAAAAARSAGSEASASETSASAAAEPAPDAPMDEASQRLLEMVEREPQVQEFVKALRGRITSVEEPKRK